MTTEEDVTTEEDMRRCAAALLDGGALLICTGAGMGVDSGLGTFRGRNAGVWQPMKTLQLDCMDICDPAWFDQDAHLAWEFWHFCYSAYTAQAPRKGHEILAEWFQSLFSATSNIDGHWARTRGEGEERVYECHGAVTHMQCVDEGNQRGGEERIWRTTPEEMARMRIPVWDLKAGEEVEVLEGDLDHRCSIHSADWVRAKVAEDGACLLDPDSGETTKVIAVRRLGQAPEDLARVSPESTLLVCPHTSRPARPNVVMFGDAKGCVKRIAEQRDALEQWLSCLSKETKLVIIEVGAVD